MYRTYRKVDVDKGELNILIEKYHILARISS